MESKFTATGVALVTPFDTTGNIDFNSLEKIVNFVIEEGVSYLVALGTTSESPTLSASEKEQVLSAILTANSGRLPVVVGKGGNNTASLVKEIKNSDFDGIDAILSVAPWYNKPNQEGIYRHFAKVAEASPVPVILYNVPGRTSSNISAETCLRLANDFENHIIAIKEASGDFKQLMDLISQKPAGFQVISGDDAITLPLISLGGTGVISVIANAFPKEFSAMVSDALSEDFVKARQKHYALIPIMEAMFAEGNPAGVKAFMSLKNLLQDKLRLPLISVSPALKQHIENLFAEVNKA